MPNPRCYFDIEIDGDPVGRLIFELFSDQCPITCENFRALCTGEKGLGQETKKPLWYQNTLIHRIIKNFVIQGGDFESGNGTGGESIYGGTFPDENFAISHDKPFLLSMANKGKNSNGSQFFITLRASTHLDQLHTVFGHVISGHEVVKHIENVKSDQNSKPLKEVKIAQCGELVLKSEKKKKKKEMDSDSSSSSDEERRKRRKKHKKEKKIKKEKKSQNFFQITSATTKAEDDIACNVDPDEIPAVPANVFLMRRTSPVADFSRSPRGRENYQSKRGPPSRTRSGRKVKGRGNMRYRTPSSSDERSGSETPPHWKQAQSKLKKLKEVDVYKGKEKHFAAEQQSNEEDDNNKSPHNRFLQSRLGLISARDFEDKKRIENKNSRNFGEERSKRDLHFDEMREEEKREERHFQDSRRKEKDARMNINENRRKRDFSPEPRRYNRDNNESETLYDRLYQENQKHGSSWFDENNQDQSDEKSHNSPLRSKIVVKSSVSMRNSRDNRRGDERESYRRHDENSERESYRRHDENSRRRDSSSDKRLRNYRDSSSDRDHSSRRSDRHNESKKEVTKDSTDKKIEKPKEFSGKAQKRLNLLENDLFRYTKIEPKPPTKSKPILVSKTSKNDMNKDEQVIQENTINSGQNKNLTALKDYETKSSEKCEHDSRDNVSDDLSKSEVEKVTHKAEEILAETSSPKHSFEFHESDASSLLKVKEYGVKTESELENNISISNSNSSQSETFCNTALAEKPDKKNNSPSNSLKCTEDHEKQTESPSERSGPNLKFVENRESNDYSFPNIIPLPDENDFNRSCEDKNIGIEKKKMETERIQVAENASSSDVVREDLQNKEKKIQHSRDSRKNISPRKSPDPHTDKKKKDRPSVSPPRSRSPLRRDITKKRMSPDTQKASSSKMTYSPLAGRSKSPMFKRKKSGARRSKSRSRSRSMQRSTSRNRTHGRYSQSPGVRQRRSHSHSRNVVRGSRSYRQSGARNHSPEVRSSFQRQNKSPPYRRRGRGRSATRRSNTRSRSHSVDKKRRHRRQASSSSSSSSSSSRSDNVKKRNLKNNSKGRNKRSSSSSSSSTASSRS